MANGDLYRKIAGVWTLVGNLNGVNGQMLYLDAQNQTQTYCVDTSVSANTITVAPATALGSYVGGLRLAVKVANAVTGATVINVSGLGNKNLKKWSSGALADLATGDISANQMLDVEYDGTQFIAMSLGGGGGGGLVLLEAHTASSSADLRFTSWYSSLYDTYQIEMYNVRPATANTMLRMQVSTNGGSTYDSGSNYGWVEWRVVPGGSAPTGGTTGQSFMCIASGDTTLSSSNIFGVSQTMKLYNPASTAADKAFTGQGTYIDTEPFIFTYIHSGAYYGTSAYNAFRIYLSSGNITSGTVRIYGLPK